MTPTDLTNTLLIEIPKRFPAVRAWRQNVIAVKVGDRFVRAGLTGMADISGIAPDGRRIEIECKLGSGKLRQQQRSWRDMILRAGGIHIEARDVDSALEQLGREMEARVR